jgi:hypothetical protein
MSVIQKTNPKEYSPIPQSSGSLSTNAMPLRKSFQNSYKQSPPKDLIDIEITSSNDQMKGFAIESIIKDEAESR